MLHEHGPAPVTTSQAVASMLSEVCSACVLSSCVVRGGMSPQQPCFLLNIDAGVHITDAGRMLHKIHGCSLSVHPTCRLQATRWIGC
jgi:hypothetical protein